MLEHVIPTFVSCIRHIDTWKNRQSRFAQKIYESRGEANVGFVKDPLAKSTNVHDLVEFLETSEFDKRFMMQLPSISKALRDWWGYESKGESHITAPVFRALLNDMANILVTGRTKAIKRAYISEIMRKSLGIWADIEHKPILEADFANLIFTFVTLMTETNHIGDFISYIDSLLAQIRDYRAEKKASLMKQRKSLLSLSTISGKQDILVEQDPTDDKTEASTQDKPVAPPSIPTGFHTQPLIQPIEIHLPTNRCSNHPQDDHRIIRNPKIKDKFTQLSTDVPLLAMDNNMNPLHIHRINYHSNRAHDRPPQEQCVVPRLSKSKSVSELLHDPVFRHTDAAQSAMYRRNLARPGVLKRIHQHHLAKQ